MLALPLLRRVKRLATARGLSGGEVGELGVRFQVSTLRRKEDRSQKSEGVR